MKQVIQKVKIDTCFHFPFFLSCGIPVEDTLGKAFKEILEGCPLEEWEGGKMNGLSMEEYMEPRKQPNIAIPPHCLGLSLTSLPGLNKGVPDGPPCRTPNQSGFCSSCGGSGVVFFEDKKGNWLSSQCRACGGQTHG